VIIQKMSSRPDATPSWWPVVLVWLVIPIAFPWAFGLAGRLLDIGLYNEAGLLAAFGAALAGWAARRHGTREVILAAVVALGLAVFGFFLWLLLLVLFLDLD
jgi:hypothetical protein